MSKLGKLGQGASTPKECLESNFCLSSPGFCEAFGVFLVVFGLVFFKRMGKILQNCGKNSFCATDTCFKKI